MQKIPDIFSLDPILFFRYVKFFGPQYHRRGSRVQDLLVHPWQDEGTDSDTAYAEKTPPVLWRSSESFVSQNQD